MRRTAHVLLAAGLLGAVASCGTATNSGNPAVGTPGAAAAPASTAPAAIRTTCEALGQAYGKNMAPFAEALTRFVTDRKTIATAQQSLAAFATAVQDATAASTDAQLKADGKQAADRMHAKSTDAQFFGAIKTTKDVDKTLGPTLTEWLSPVQRHCT
ncbi:hypothetical protein JIG36_36805 [Actinoplanes sp. LDG1-06]|uniref:Lipoprotein n=1 Tax=Paractinoplanes ovalisporus TaxID=2810368 RepID=A0ABS2AMR0_9ACTN|nr:hypothetical protein [Actinoplanes ovalisporus]MBM2621076.1 hypothetical protein [Actinoplanes ovalisporus]